MIEDIDEALLAKMPLPSGGGDKEDRGRVLVVGGSIEVPGGAMLAGLAALRAGAGKLQIAAEPAVTLPMAVQIPEARVFGWEAARVLTALEGCAAALAGPGMVEEKGAEVIVRSILDHPGKQPLVLDAAAMAAAARTARPLVITPHAGEMAKLLDVAKDQVESDPVRFARDAAERLGAIVVLKGATTHICEPGGRILRHTQGVFGLATSGSGDVLAGIMVGLLARGAGPLAAAAWAVSIHANAGALLSKRIAPIGFLAREILDEIPGLLAQKR